MKKNIFFVLTIILVGLTFISCTKKSNTVPVETGSNTDSPTNPSTPSPTPTPTPTPTPAPGDILDQQYRSVTIIGHSRNEVSSTLPLVIWQSDTDPGQSGNQEVFNTDAKLYIRAMALAQPTQGSLSNYGNECTQVPISSLYGYTPYDKLKFTVGLRLQGQSFTSHFWSKEITASTSSFSVPIEYGFPINNDFVIDLYNFQWNNISPCSSSNPDQFCDLWGSNSVGLDCISLELQYATDESIRLGAP